MTTEELTNLRDALVKAWVLLSVRLGAFGLEAFALHLSSLYQDDLHFRADCEKLVTAFIHGGIEDLQGLELNGRETVNLFCRFFFAEKGICATKRASSNCIVPRLSSCSATSDSGITRSSSAAVKLREISRNPISLLRLRRGTGPAAGANFDTRSPVS